MPRKGPFGRITPDDLTGSGVPASSLSPIGDYREFFTQMNNQSPATASLVGQTSAGAPPSVSPAGDYQQYLVRPEVQAAAGTTSVGGKPKFDAMQAFQDAITKRDSAISSASEQTQPKQPSDLATYGPPAISILAGLLSLAAGTGSKFGQVAAGISAAGAGVAQGVNESVIRAESKAERKRKELERSAERSFADTLEAIGIGQNYNLNAIREQERLDADRRAENDRIYSRLIDRQTQSNKDRTAAETKRHHKATEGKTKEKPKEKQLTTRERGKLVNEIIEGQQDSAFNAASSDFVSRDIEDNKPFGARNATGMAYWTAEAKKLLEQTPPDSSQFKMLQAFLGIDTQEHRQSIASDSLGFYRPELASLLQDQPQFQGQQGGQITPEEINELREILREIGLAP